jgi:hypothetical protein
MKEMQAYDRYIWSNIALAYVLEHIIKRYYFSFSQDSRLAIYEGIQEGINEPVYLPRGIKKGIEGGGIGRK